MSEWEEQFDERYAEIVLKGALNLQKGDKILMQASVSDYPFLRLLAQKAYEWGAKHVMTRVNDPYILRSRLEYNEEYNYTPQFHQAEMYEMIAEGWNYLRIDAPYENAALQGLDVTKMQAFFKKQRELIKPRMKVISYHKTRWTIICYPSKPFAQTALKQESISQQEWDNFKGVIGRILYLDQEQPLEAQRAHMDALHKRKEILNNLQLHTLHFTNEGTDLKVGLSEQARWHGGGDFTPEGLFFWANLPTQEVFTTPNKRLTEGHVTMRCPVDIMGATVEDIYFEFKAGKLVKATAGKNNDVLQQFIDTDEGSRFLGEVALVDRQNPIAKSGLIFHSILYDENASCHIALGQAYANCLEGFERFSKADFEKLGYNDSLVHTDFMLKDKGMRVVGIDKNEKNTAFWKMVVLFFKACLAFKDF